MDCFEGSKVVLAHWVVIFVQLILVIVLIVYGVNGNQEMDKSDAPGVPYYIGAFMTSGVYGALAIFTAVLLILYRLDVESGSGAVYCTVCLLTYLGLPTFLLSMVFTVVFGIAQCKTDEETTYDQAGSCSYKNNIDNNYKIATVCLILIILLFITNMLGIFLLCKYGDPSDSSIYDGATVGPSGSSSTGGNPTLKKMQEDRERRNDITKQLRMGRPRHMLIRKF